MYLLLLGTTNYQLTSVIFIFCHCSEEGSLRNVKNKVQNCPEDENLLCFLFQSIHLILDIWHLHEVPENCPKGFPITQNMDFDPRTMSLACSEAELLPKLDFHFLKSSSTPYSLSTPFLTVRWIWGFWKWPLMIPHHPKHGVWHQNHDHGTFRS